MSGDFTDLYQELILDHQKNPRNFGELPGANRHADGNNPLCGDTLSLDVRVGPDGVLEDLKFRGSGCAISRASASLMTVALKGRTLKEAGELFDLFHDLVTGREKPEDAARLGKLLAFSGIRKYPARVKCASLAWHTLKAALDGKGPATVTTEENG